MDADTTDRKKKAIQTEKREKQILWISFVTGLFFAISEFIISIYTHSQSVLMDAAYDSTELIVIILTLFLTPLFHKPISEEHPYGFLQVESIFVIVKGCMMLSVTVGLSINSIEMALSGGNPVNGIQISLFQLVLAIGCFFIYLLMRYLNRSLSSPTVKAELLGWKLDIAYSGGMTLAFFASSFLDKTPLAFISPYFDQIVAVAIILFMLPENMKMLWRALQDIFLFSPEKGITEEIKSICDEILEKYNFKPIFYDITRTGRRLWVSVYFKIEEDYLSLHQLQQASHSVRTTLKEKFENCSSELILASEELQTLLRQLPPIA